MSNVDDAKKAETDATAKAEEAKRAEDARLATAKRVEEAKQKIQAERELMRKEGTKISAKMLQGITYEEEYPVKLIGGNVGLLVIRPLAEGEIIQIFSEIGIDRLNKMGTSDQLKVEDYEFFWSVVSASSGIPKDLIKKTFAVGESSIVGQHILEMSGFGANAGDKMERFPSK
jgi:predicted Holliday junction resolvase-like endonuclease